MVEVGEEDEDDFNGGKIPGEDDEPDFGAVMGALGARVSAKDYDDEDEEEELVPIKAKAHGGLFGADLSSVKY